MSSSRLVSRTVGFDKGHLADLTEVEYFFLKKLVHEAEITYHFSWQIIPMNHDVSGSKDTSLVIDETLKFRKRELYRKELPRQYCSNTVEFHESSYLKVRMNVQENAFVVLSYQPEACPKLLNCHYHLNMF